MDPQVVRGLRLAMLLGVGIGLLAASVSVALFRPVERVSNAEIMERARALGMERLTDMPRTGSGLSSGQGAAATAPGQITLMIRPETTVDDVAAMLKQAGAIADSEGFLRKARESGLTGPFAPGPKTVTQGEGLEQILSKLTPASKP